MAHAGAAVAAGERLGQGCTLLLFVPAAAAADGDLFGYNQHIQALAGKFIAVSMSADDTYSIEEMWRLKGLFQQLPGLQSHASSSATQWALSAVTAVPTDAHG